MKNLNVDTLRLLIMQVVTNIVTVLVLGGIVDWTAELTAAVMAIVNSTLLLLAYVIKPSTP